MIRYIHKKLLFIKLLTIAACVLQACSSDSPDIAPGENHQEMKFVTTEVARAFTSGINYAGSRFALFGDMKYSTYGPSVIFHNKEVEYNGIAWTYEGTQYWHPEHEHSFVAVYPSKALKDAGDPQYEASMLSFTYTIPTADDKTIDKEGVLDLLVATHRRQYSNGDSNPVSLRFQHLLSLVNLSPAFDDNLLSDDDYIKVYKLELSGINSSARFDITPASILSGGQTDDMVIDMIPQQYDNSTLVLQTPVIVKNHEGNVNLFAHEDAIIMLPQTFAAQSDAEIKIFFSINEESTIREVILPLNGRNWESGRSYIYKFTIERTGLKLDNCEINPWNDVKGDEITVD